MKRPERGDEPESERRRGYKGVRRRRWGKWVSEIRVPGTRERLWLGSYATPEAAAVAHGTAVYLLRGGTGAGAAAAAGDVAALNFPERAAAAYGAWRRTPAWPPTRSSWRRGTARPRTGTRIVAPALPARKAAARARGRAIRTLARTRAKRVLPVTVRARAGSSSLSPARLAWMT